MSKAALAFVEVFYKPGETVPQSGVYEAIHYKHKPVQEVTAVQGENFLECRGCGREVRFRLAHAADKMKFNWNFRKPLSVANE